MLRPIIFSAFGAMALLSVGACASGGHRETTVSTGSERIPRITALYELATCRPTHPFRKPVRDQQMRARRGLEAECSRWLAELQGDAVPTALTGSSNVTPIPPTADVAALRSSLEKLRSAADRSDAAAMRAAHAEAVVAYRQVEGDLNRP